MCPNLAALWKSYTLHDRWSKVWRPAPAHFPLLWFFRERSSTQFRWSGIAMCSHRSLRQLLLFSSLSLVVATVHHLSPQQRQHLSSQRQPVQNLKHVFYPQFYFRCLFLLLDCWCSCCIVSWSCATELATISYITDHMTYCTLLQLYCIWTSLFPPYLFNVWWLYLSLFFSFFLVIPDCSEELMLVE